MTVAEENGCGQSVTILHADAANMTWIMLKKIGACFIIIKSFPISGELFPRF